MLHFAALQFNRLLRLRDKLDRLVEWFSAQRIGPIRYCRATANRRDFPAVGPAKFPGAQAVSHPTTLTISPQP